MADLNFDEILNKIAQSPEALEKIAQISKGAQSGDTNARLAEMIGIISPLLENSNQNNSSKESNKADEIIENSDTPPSETQDYSKKADEILSLPVMKITEQIRRNSPLLTALKPYLNKNRCDLIDSVLKMAQVADLMRLIK